MASSAPPRYQQIADELRQNIEAAVYHVGDQLPTEAELSRRFDVNRHTLRRAIDILRQEGLVRVDRGRGMFVAAAPIALTIGKRVRYNEALKAQGLTLTREPLRISELPADAPIAKRLQVPIGESVILFEKLSLADGYPLSIASSYFPHRLMPDIAAHCETYQSISKMLHDQYGFDHIRQSTRISARVVQPRDAKYLGVPLQSPILLAESVNVNQFEDVIEYGVSRFRCDRMELVFE
ncbi:MAG: phosphonate metabolism transcriptional regulator PhnF [Cyanobacteria bacterium P01_D01_bin.44]